MTMTSPLHCIIAVLRLAGATETCKWADSELRNPRISRWTWDYLQLRSLSATCV